MKLSLLTLLAATAIATPVLVSEDNSSIEERAAKKNQFKALQADYKQTNTDAVSLNKTLNEFGDNAQPTFGQAIALEGSGNDVQTDLNKTLADAKKSAVLTAAQSTTLYNYINTVLLPTTTDVVQNFIDHYPGLNKQGLSGAIKTSLTQQRDTTQQIGTASTKILRGAAKENSPALTKKLVAQFNRGIKKYSS